MALSLVGDGHGLGSVKLVAELLPGCDPVAIEIDFQHRVAAGCAELPEVVNPGHRVAVSISVVQVDVPAAVDTGISGCRPELADTPGPHFIEVPRADRAVLAGGDRVPVSVEYDPGIQADQPPAPSTPETRPAL